MLLQALSEASVCLPSDGAWPRRAPFSVEGLDARAGVCSASILEAAGPVTGEQPLAALGPQPGRGRSEEKHLYSGLPAPAVPLKEAGSP